MPTTDDGRGTTPEDARVPASGPASAAAPDAVLDPALAEYAPLGAVALTDAERWPTLTAAERRPLDVLAQDPHAPHWAHRTGDRLEPADLATLRAEVDRLRSPGAHGAPDSTATTATAGPANRPPDWVADLVARAHAVVPRYRTAAREGRSSAGSPLAELTPIRREDLAGDLAAFVPLDVDLSRVMEGTSSGSTGAALRIPLHPVSVASDLVLLQHLVAQAGARWSPTADRLGLVNLVDQANAFTYVSAMTAFAGADRLVPLMARINLDRAAWRAPGDRERFLSRWDPQVISTTPLTLLRLLDLAADGLALHPVAIVSGAVQLTPALRAAVSARWDVPLVDLYGLRETGAVAARTDDGPHVVVGRRVWAEVLDDAGEPVPDGTRGEVTVTVDENPYLPLLRYRTGDHAALRRDGERVELVGLDGRAPVRLQHADGTWRPSIDATQLLQAYGLAAWSLHQAGDGSVQLAALPAALSGSAARDAARAAGDAVGRLLGRPVAVTVVDDARGLGPGKPRRFSSDLGARAST